MIPARILFAVLALLLCQPSRGLAQPAGSAGASPSPGRSLLVVAGDNYEEFHAFRHFIEPPMAQKLEKLGWTVGECPWPSLTAETLARFDAVIFLQTPDTFIKPDKEAQLAKMQKLLADYLARGGGALIFPDLFRGTVHKTVNTWLEPYGMRAFAQTIREKPANVRPFDAYPAFGVSMTQTIAPDPLTEGVTRFAYPVGNELTTSFGASADWRILVRAEASAATIPNDGINEKDPLIKESPPIVAVREAGGGRLAYWAGHSSFYVLRPFHAYWDRGRIVFEGDGFRLFTNLLDWLAADPKNALGGFRKEEQEALFHYTDKPERLEPQDFRLPGKPRNGVIGLQSSFSGKPHSVAELAAEAKRLGLDYVVFTEEAEKLGAPELWERYVSECAAATDDGFIAFPGVLVQSPETGDRAVAFALRKPWPETPWNKGEFDCFVRVGVNNAWRAFFALLDPVDAPVPVANQGAVNALAVQTFDSGKWKDASELFQRTQREMWGFYPIRYQAVESPTALQEAARQGTTTLYAERWGKRFNITQDEISSSAVSAGPILTTFNARAESTWLPPFESRYSGRVKLDNLQPGQVVELWFSQERVRAVTATAPELAFDFSFVAPGAGHLFVRVLGPGGEPLLQAFAHRFAKLRHSSFVGSDRMNGYWYPVTPAKADSARSMYLDGAYGVIGTSVYPQLGWGDHWFFRSENQMESEPLGFEVGSPPGTIERMVVGFYVRREGRWEMLAPWRGMTAFSSDAAVWSDSDVRVRREPRENGQRRIQVSPSPDLERSSAVTGFRWDQHAAWLVEAHCKLKPGVEPASVSAEHRVLILRAGNAWEKFSQLEILHQKGRPEKRPITSGLTVPLSAGEGVSLGDVPMGMVSVWALQDLVLDVRNEGNPVIGLSLPKGDWPLPADESATARYLVVISAKRGDAPMTLEAVRNALFTENYARQERNRRTPERTPLQSFRQAMRVKSDGGWTSWSLPGAPWRGELGGLTPVWAAGALWREDDAWQWQPLQVAGGKGRVFLERAPKGRGAFLGHPVVANKRELRVELGRIEGGAWPVTVHNPSSKPLNAELSIHPGLRQQLELDTCKVELEPGATVTLQAKWITPKK